MKTKISFSKKPHTSLLLATATLLLLSMQCGTFADDASWISLGSTDWNTNGNWLTDPAGGGYPGTTAGNTATFRDLSDVTSLFVSATPANSLAGITFTVAETHSFTITVNPFVTLTLSGTGIVNNSPSTQNFVTAVSGFNTGVIAFTNNATAGSMTSFTNNGGAAFGVFGGFTQFFNTSTAGSGTFTNFGGTVSGANGGFTAFNGIDATHFSTAGSGTFNNNGATVTGAFGGFTEFHSYSSADSGTFNNEAGTVSGATGGFTRYTNTSTAGSATINNNAATVSGAGGGSTGFFDTSTAGSSTITNNGGTVNGGGGGSTQFSSTSTAGSATINNNGATAIGAFASVTVFGDSSTAGSATINNNGSTVSGASGGFTRFFGIDATHFSTAGTATITNNGGTVSGAGGGFTQFTGTSTAGSATITNNGGTVSGAGGSRTVFFDSSTAGSATLIANGGVGAGGSIFFIDTSTGGTSTVKVFGNGNLDISAHSAVVSSVTIGSLEGSGNVFLGANNLTVGSNNLSKTFSGVIQDGGGLVGGTGGSLTKIGTGAFTLTGANTYTGGTTVNDGHLFVNNTSGSGTGTGNVTVNAIGAAIGTLGGNGTISGLVTVNGGATLAPGPTGNGSTGILNTGTLTLNSDSNFSLDLNGPLAGTNYDQVDVTGEVFITGSNLLINTALGLAVGEHLFIVENDGSDAVTGTFAGLANGATFTQDGVTFQIDYFASGDGGAFGPAVPGNDIELTVTAVVPEPSTWLGSVLAFVGLAYMQRRRFAQMFASRVKANSVVAV
jgi:hypothetical protein